MKNYLKSKFYYELCSKNEVKLRLGEVYYHLGDWLSAFDFLENGEMKGDVCVKLGYLDLAILNYAGCHEKLGDVYAQQGRWKWAAACYEQRGLVNQDSSVYMKLIPIYIKLDAHDQALQLIKIEYSLDTQFQLLKILRKHNY